MSDMAPSVARRKFHHKSRLGCQNCKLRRIKCDESKPGCRRCSAAGYLCIYGKATAGQAAGRSQGGISPLLQPAHASFISFQTFQMDYPEPSSTDELHTRSVSRQPSTTTFATSANIIHTARETVSCSSQLISVGKAPCRIAPHDLALPEVSRLEFYQNLVTEGDRSVPVTTYGGMIRGLGSDRPYLIHAYETLAYLHDNDLCLAAGRRPCSAHRAALAQHWYYATVLYSQKLAKPKSLTDKDREGLWATAGILCVASLAYLESHDPWLAFPLRPTRGNDLDWVSMNIGKRAIWNVCYPPAEGADMNSASERDVMAFEGVMATGVLPLLLLDWLEIDDTSGPESNVYYVSASILSHLIPDPCNPSTVLRFLVFNGAINEPFRNLLERKDPRALILMVYFYAKVCVYEDWWLNRRAKVEGEAICLFLEIFHADNQTIQDLLAYPRAVFALLQTSISEATQRSTYILDAANKVPSARPAQ